MHEMGIASSILDAAGTELLRYPGQRATRIGVVIGEYAGVDTESLRFCFEVLSKDRNQNVALDIEWRTASEELKFAYLEIDEALNEQDRSGKESIERERSDCGAAA